VQDAAEFAMEVADFVDADLVGQLKVDGVVVGAHE
jgi:hypothetical protein